MQAAAALLPVQRGRGALEQTAEVGRVVVVGAADAGLDVHPIVANVDHGFAQLRLQAARTVQALARSGVCKQDRELIAGEAGDEVRRAHVIDQHFAERPQRFIAGARARRRRRQGRCLRSWSHPDRSRVAAPVRYSGGTKPGNFMRARAGNSGAHFCSAQNRNSSGSSDNR